MQFSADSTVAAVQGAMTSLSALVVQYAFSVIGAVLILIIGFVIAGMLERWSYRGLGSWNGFDETLRKFLSKIVRYGVLALVFVTVLSQFGVQTASIIAALGAAGLAIGLALQGTLQNVAAGIMLLVLRPFKVGEFIEAGGTSGTVQEIGLFATEFKTLDGLFLLAPNSELWSQAVKNYSRNPTRRNDLVIGIAYDDDIGKAMEIYRDLMAGDTRVLKDPEPYIYVSNLGDSAVEVTCRYWTATADWWTTSRDMTRKAKERFDAAGLSIPFPQRDVHLYQTEPQAAAAE
ncbi:mechanosensitive ion channel protein [Zhengella mangrovi]|uniref:Small-conductance mechanosensitive channel n=1 Tax=Zhengella mangrovi TaxID=1982044 RepID=A0A2G1QRX0_9HYPH|nr:mechanosensitive ion channel domain-containing protein [Zhengella mangrovi]PHP68286.1 mechanosensitive ion channel protein [Zhengella mangrovi]